MKEWTNILTACIFVVVALSSCGDTIENSYIDYTDEEYAIISKRLNLPSEAYHYSKKFEEGAFSNVVGEEDIRFRSDHKATLGRVLFYDKKLSINEAISCASCHKQELGFADDKALSEGFDGQLTKRNSLPLGNTIGFETAYGGGEGRPMNAQFGWDEANNDIAEQSKAAILSDIEMGLDIPTLIERIEKDEIYPILFTKGYGDSRVLQHRILDAIEEFVNNIAATETRFDKAASQNEDDPFINFEQFSHEENMGKTLYLNKCASCHSFDHKFTQKAVANNGLDLVYEDKGVGEITKQASDNGVFKVPFLRNIEKTGPYMHDGRFKSLREVINHYSEGIQNHPNLSTELKLGGIPRRMNFSEEEKDALEAYLLTLTDNVIEKDDRFSDPFIQ